MTDAIRNLAQRLPRPNRRLVLAGLAGAATVGGASRDALAQAPNKQDAPLYFVPGGRLGFKQPPEISAWTNGWILLSGDHTFRVLVQESMRFAPEYGNYLWDKDRRSKIVPSTLHAPGFEQRRFRDLRYDPSDDYADESIVLQDATWVGEVSVATGNLAGAITIPGGQNRRWREVMDAVLGSIVVRLMPPPAQSMAEFKISMNTDGLNPRFASEKMILGLYEPKNTDEAWAANYPNITLLNLGILPLGPPEDLEKGTTHTFEAYRTTLGGTAINGGKIRGLRFAEQHLHSDTYATRITAFGRTRQQEITAFYTSSSRTALLDAQERAFRSFEFVGG